MVYALRYSTITMPVQTRNQTRQQQIDEQKLGSTDEPVIMDATEPAAGKPPCYLAWGRFLTEKEYHASSEKSAQEVTTMIATKPCTKAPRVIEETTHGLDWSTKIHYMSIGGQCGQSCACCRADVYKSGLDEDAKWGACAICLST